MPKPLTVPMTPGISVSDNYIVRITALDPTTGAVVSGVNVSLSAILGIDVSNTTTAGDTTKPPTVGKSFFVGDSI